MGDVSRRKLMQNVVLLVIATAFGFYVLLMCVLMAFFPDKWKASAWVLKGTFASYDIDGNPVQRRTIVLMGRVLLLATAVALICLIWFSAKPRPSISFAIRSPIITA